MNPNSPRLAGLFAGIGGIELGFQNAGFSPVFANEIDQKASTTYRLNHPHTLITRDISKLESREIPKVEVITGGFPCQAFSVAGYRQGFHDPRGNLFFEVARILEDKKPPVLFLENVKNLRGHDGGRTFEVILETLETLGYHIKSAILNSTTHGGIPQNRERIYIVGFRSKKKASNFEFPGSVKKLEPLSKYIDFDNPVDDIFYYKDKYMSAELEKMMTRMDTVYQWRRQYVRENKSGVSPTLTANMGTGGHNVPLILTSFGIRKLTPKECLNLMGFPKKFKIPLGMANSSIYKQAGNAVVVPVVQRIANNMLATLENRELPHQPDSSSLPNY